MPYSAPIIAEAPLGASAALHFPRLTGATPFDRRLDMVFRPFPALLGALVVASFTVLADGPATAQQNETASQQIRNPSGLTIPRWVSIRAKEANMRTGPGARYPIDWVLQRRNLPAEVVAEFENWRQVRMPDGTVGWVHKSMLSGKRMAVVTEAEVRVRQQPDSRALVAAFIGEGVIVKLDECNQAWCRVAVNSHNVDGWLPREALWGVYAGETVGR